MAHTLTYELGQRLQRRLRLAASARRSPTIGSTGRRWTSSRRSSDRELADLGISRLSIREIAHDSVYGA